MKAGWAGHTSFQQYHETLPPCFEAYNYGNHMIEEVDESTKEEIRTRKLEEQTCSHDHFTARVFFLQYKKWWWNTNAKQWPNKCKYVNRTWHYSFSLESSNLLGANPSAQEKKCGLTKQDY